MKKAFWFSSRVLFLILLSILYALGSKTNPIPFTNIIFWSILLYFFISSAKELETDPKTQRFLILGIAITLCYVIASIKNAYYIASYNEYYLSGIHSMVPDTWFKDSMTSILKPSIWYQKLKFTIGFEHLIINFGNKFKFDFGVLGTNLIRSAEYAGLFAIPFYAMYRGAKRK